MATQVRATYPPLTAAPAFSVSLSTSELTAIVDCLLDALRYSERERMRECGSRLGSGYIALYGPKFVKIVSTEAGDETKQRSVHAFVERSTGNLIKAAGWSQPQRDKGRALAVRYRMADPRVLEQLLAAIRDDPQAFTGGYLYVR